MDKGNVFATPRADGTQEVGGDTRAQKPGLQWEQDRGCLTRARTTGKGHGLQNLKGQRRLSHCQRNQPNRLPALPLAKPTQTEKGKE